MVNDLDSTSNVASNDPRLAPSAIDPLQVNTFLQNLGRTSTIQEISNKQTLSTFDPDVVNDVFNAPPMAQLPPINHTANVHANSKPLDTTNFGGSSNSNRRHDTAAPYSTAGSSLGAAPWTSVLTPAQFDEILIHFIVGKTGSYIVRYLHVKYGLVISNDAVNDIKRRNADLILEGRKARYENVKLQGMAMTEERIISLQELAEQYQHYINFFVSQNPNSAPPAQVSKEFREILRDLAEETGGRQKGNTGLGDGAITVAVVSGPQKAATADQWIQQASDTQQMEIEAKEREVLQRQGLSD